MPIDSCGLRRGLVPACLWLAACSTALVRPMQSLALRKTDAIVCVVDSATGAEIATIPLDGRQPSPQHATGEAQSRTRNSNGRETWVAHRADDQVAALDAITSDPISVLETAADPVCVAMTPDGSKALVCCAEAGCVQVFDVATKRLLGTIDLLSDKTEFSPLPIGVFVAPTGDLAWIACQRGEFVAVVDLASYAMVDRLPIVRDLDADGAVRKRAPMLRV